MADPGEAMPLREGPLEFRRETVIDLQDQGAPGTDKVMVMPVVLRGHEFKSGRPIAKVEPPHKTHSLQGMKVPVHRGEVAALSQSGVDLPIRHRRLVPSQNVQDCLSRSSDPTRVPAQPFRQLVERLLDQPVRMLVLSTGGVHGAAGRWGGRRRNRAASDTRNRPTAVRTMAGPQGRSNW